MANFLLDKLYPILAIAIFTLSLRSEVSSTENSKWFMSQASTNISSMTLASEGRSVISCGITCSQRQNCTDFCYDVIVGSCYIRDGNTQSAYTPTGSDFRCFAFDTCRRDLGYSSVYGHCLKYYENGLSQGLAANVCALEGGHLYFFKSLAEDIPPMEALLNTHGLTISPTLGLWVGADDRAVEGDFFWSDGSRLHDSSEVWSSGEPNNNLNSEDCVEFSGENSRLNDKYCPAAKPFICQLY